MLKKLLTAIAPMKMEYPASFKFADQSCMLKRTSVSSISSPISKLNNINIGLVIGFEIKLPLAAAKMLNLKNRYKNNTLRNPKPNEGKTPVNAPNAAPDAISFTLDFSLANFINVVLILLTRLSFFMAKLSVLTDFSINIFLLLFSFMIYIILFRSLIEPTAKLLMETKRVKPCAYSKKSG